MKTVLKYPGSKWNIAGKLVNMIPQHHSYVEPFFGSGAVLFNKNVSDIETVNDLDSDVTNLFRCIQKDSERLAKLDVLLESPAKIRSQKLLETILKHPFIGIPLAYDNPVDGLNYLAENYSPLREFLLRPDASIVVNNVVFPLSATP